MLGHRIMMGGFLLEFGVPYSTYYKPMMYYKPTPLFSPV